MALASARVQGPKMSGKLTLAPRLIVNLALPKAQCWVLTGAIGLVGLGAFGSASRCSAIDSHSGAPAHPILAWFAPPSSLSEKRLESLWRRLGNESVVRTAAWGSRGRGSRG